MQDVSVLPLWRCLHRRGGPDLYVTEYFRVHRDSHPEKEIVQSIIGMAPQGPVMAQMIGNDPIHLVRTARHLEDHTPCIGIDLNLGCPAPKVCGKAAGGALLKDHDLIRRAVEALRPVVRGQLTLKTRLGFESPDEFTTLLDLFATLPLDGLAIHGRTVRERYQSPVHPEWIAEAVTRLPYRVMANGNIVSLATARAMQSRTGAAGLMIGRGAIRNPWLFAQIRQADAGENVCSPNLRDVLGYIEELSEEVRLEGAFTEETPLVHRLKKFTNYITIGLSDGVFSQALRRALTLDQFRSICRQYLDRDEPFPEEPADDGSLFCGFAELLKETQE
jgi:tRNA-dihydrouridine synthase